MKKYLPTIAIFLCVLALWEWASRTGQIPSIFIPPPSLIAIYLFDSIKDGSLLSSTFLTFKRLFYGYLISVIIGIPVGMLQARSSFMKKAFGWIVLGLQTLPSVCWVPLALLWFGQSEYALLFIVIMGSLWSIILGTESGIRNIPPLYIRAARTMGSKGLHTWFFVFIPASLPFIVSGLKQGWAFAWRSLMAAEIFVPILSGFGLGQLLQYGRELNAMDQVIGIMFVLVLIGLMTDRFLFGSLESFIHSRWGTDRQ